MRTSLLWTTDAVNNVLCPPTSLSLAELGVSVVFETRRTGVSRLPIRARPGGLTSLERCDALSCSSNPAAGVGEGPAATSSGVSRGPSPTPAAGALATNPQWMISL
jgi:hypothetical protein